MASYPTYNPSIWTGGISEREFKRLFGTGDGEPILERATQGEYPPGSTFKVTTLTAGIKFGDSLYGSYDCPAVDERRRPQRSTTTSATAGSMSLHQALVLSCDTVFYNIGYQIWQHDNRKARHGDQPESAGPVRAEDRDGLGLRQADRDRPAGREQRHDPDQGVAVLLLEGQRAPRARTGASTAGRTAATSSRSSTTTATTATSGTPGQAIIASIGQGYVAVTPLQLARAYAALANGGTLYSPRIGEELLSPAGKVVQKITPPVAGHLPASKTTLAYIRSALQGVITSGTAAGTFGGFPLARCAWPARPEPRRCSARTPPRCSRRSRRAATRSTWWSS